MPVIRHGDLMSVDGNIYTVAPPASFDTSATAVVEPSCVLVHGERIPIERLTRLTHPNRAERRRQAAMRRKG